MFIHTFFLRKVTLAKRTCFITSEEDGDVANDKGEVHYPTVCTCIPTSMLASPAPFEPPSKLYLRQLNQLP
jgi:hypothetical protein